MTTVQPPTSNLSSVDQIVVLMLENRSFDHMPIGGQPVTDGARQITKSAVVARDSIA
jgi:phospholipase C